MQGRPRPEITWLKNNETIPSHLYEQTLDKNSGVCKIIINSASSFDQGLIVCRAEYDGKIDEVSTYIRHKKVESKPKPSEKPQNKLSTDNHNKEEDIGRRRHPERISRFRSKVPRSQTPNSAFSRSRERSLYNEPSKTPERYYPEGNRYIIKERKPMFSTQLTDRIAAEGSTAKFTCNVLGGETEFSWFKNNRPLPISPKYRTIAREGLATLEVFNTNTEDSGTYMCVARNEFGDTSTFSKFKVYGGCEYTPLSPSFTRSIKGSIYVHILL